MHLLILTSSSSLIVFLTTSNVPDTDDFPYTLQLEVPDV